MTRTRVGMIVRAATEKPDLTRALGINVGRWVTPVFGFGIALAGLAGVLAAPFRAITADMGSDFIIILFAVVVIGGLGSIVGAVVAGFLVGLVEAFGQAYAPTFAQILIFVLMAVVDARAAGRSLRTRGSSMSAPTSVIPDTSLEEAHARGHRRTARGSATVCWPSDWWSP